jgi:hypothetical protein
MMSVYQGQIVFHHCQEIVFSFRHNPMLFVDKTLRFGSSQQLPHQDQQAVTES